MRLLEAVTLISHSTTPMASRYRGRGAPALIAINLLAALSLGCEQPNVGIVAGTVTIDGAPAKSGSIAFFPSDGQAPTAGAEILDGQYSAKVAPGSARVEIRVSKVIGEKKLYDTPDSPVKPVLAESLPPRYNDESELTIDVQVGENEKNWELTTK